jgi:hypothetical protein
VAVQEAVLETVQEAPRESIRNKVNKRAKALLVKAKLKFYSGSYDASTTSTIPLLSYQLSS